LSKIDTSAKAVEFLAKRLKRDIDWKPDSLCERAATTLRDLVVERDALKTNHDKVDTAFCFVVAERDAAQAKVARLREALEAVLRERSPAAQLSDACLLARDVLAQEPHHD